jgi:hypothetical protein
MPQPHYLPVKHGFEVPYKDVEVAVDFPPGMSFSRLLLCVICFNIPVRYIKDLHGDTFLRKRQAGLMVQKWRACYVSKIPNDKDLFAEISQQSLFLAM